VRLILFLILITTATSCDKLPFTKSNDTIQLDTIVDFTTVDFYPSFKACDTLIDKNTKADCFRNTIHQKIGAELQKYSFTIKDSIDETIYVDLVINAHGEVLFDELESSIAIKNQLPELDSIIKISVQKIDTIYPAIKRGIPVTTKYKLPIRILLKE
jgi:hypothetical protein